MRRTKSGRKRAGAFSNSSSAESTLIRSSDGRDGAACDAICPYLYSDIRRHRTTAWPARPGKFGWTMPTVEIECKSPSISKARVCSVFIHAGCQAISLFSGWSFRRTVVSLGPWIEHIRWRVDKHHTKSDVIRPKSNIPPRRFII